MSSVKTPRKPLTEEQKMADRERCKEKYHRLNYREKHRESRDVNRHSYWNKFPEKLAAKKACIKLTKLREKGMSLHHFAYMPEHYTNVIPLSVADHHLLHRHIRYDQELKMYRNLQGELLETRESHIELLNKIKNGKH